MRVEQHDLYTRLQQHAARASSSTPQETTSRTQPPSPARPSPKPVGNLTVNWQVPMPANLTAYSRRRSRPPTRPAVPPSRLGNLTVNWQVSMRIPQSPVRPRPRLQQHASKNHDTSRNRTTAPTTARVEQHDLCASSSTPQERRRQPESNTVTARVEQHDLDTRLQQHAARTTTPAQTPNRDRAGAPRCAETGPAARAPSNTDPRRQRMRPPGGSPARSRRSFPTASSTMSSSDTPTNGACAVSSPATRVTTHTADTPSTP